MDLDMANTNHIQKLENIIATTTAKLQKVCQLLNTSKPPAQPHSKSSQHQGPAAPPHAEYPKDLTTSLSGIPTSKLLWAWQEAPKHLSWADCMSYSEGEFTVNKPFMTVQCKKKKMTPEPIIPKPHPHNESEVIITLNTTITDATTIAD
jgi:hypothetical protein